MRHSMLRAFPLITAVLSLVLLLVGCSPTLEQTTPKLPPGFLEARVPEGDLSALLYLSQQPPVTIPLARFGNPLRALERLPLIGDIVPDVGIDSLAAWVGPDLDSFGARVTFQQHVWAQAADVMLLGRDEVTRWREGGELYLVRGTGGWADAMKLALQSGDATRFQDAQPDIWDLMSLLPEQPPTDPVAAGFVRLEGDLMDLLSVRVGLDIGGIAQAFGAINVTDIVFVAYTDASLALPTEIGPDFFNEAGVGAIFVMRSTYPGFLLSFFLDNFADRLELEKGSVVSGQDVLVREFKDVHLVVKALGNTIFLALAPSREQAEALMASALEPHV